MITDASDVLIIQPLMSELTARLSARFGCHYLYQCENIDDYLRQHGHKIRAVATRGDVGLEPGIMDRLPNLEIISVFGVGVDAIDLQAAARRNITITITSGILTDDVADLALGLLIAVSRQLINLDGFARDRKWPESAPVLTSKVSGKRIGILGLGKIGQAIAKRALAFDMKIGYCDNNVIDNPHYFFYSSPKALAESSDYLVLALPGHINNKGIINGEILEALGPEGILINVARGSLVNEGDLINALQKRKIKGAGLDVYDNEPHIPEELFALENVVITPHIASATNETRDNMARNVFDNLESYFSRGVAVTPMILEK